MNTHDSASAGTSPWKLYIDTGGTFTDCLAFAPDGGEHRCKVLSSSSLRGLASPAEKPCEIKISIHERVPDDFFTGFEFLLLKEPESTYNVKAYDAGRSTLTLDGDIDLADGDELAFELRSPEEAPILGACIITKTPMNGEFPPMQMRLSTTKGTNALLERAGAKTLFLITQGYRDLLHIRNQQRPELFALDIQKSKPFFRHIVEVPERIDADGTVITPLDKELLKERIEPFLGEIESVGVCLMNSYRNDEHEIQLAGILRELGVKFISRSAELSPEIKIVPRAVTTDVNAYLEPIMERYLSRISDVIHGHSFRVMSSGGTLVESEHYRPKDGLLSGPAGGVIGAAAIGKRVAKSLSGFSQGNSQTRSDAIENLTGFEKIISFDMGGTSSDVARFDGEIDYVYEHSVGDATLSAPAVEIETVAAGGGSICGFDGQSLIVGPESAGADPGPACYGRGGPLTITDVNLLSGRLHPANFHISIVPEAAEERLNEILEAAGKLSREEALDGFLDIANERMAQAIRKISLQKGFDPSEYAMVAFGGAGAQHALAIAAKLNMEQVLVPSDAGLLSAYGLQQARLEQIATKQVLKQLDEVESELGAWFDELKAKAMEELENQGVSENSIEITRQNLFLRLKGQDSSLEIDFSKTGTIEDNFRKAYEDQYGHWIEDREIEVEAIRVKASERSPIEGGQSEGANVTPGRGVSAESEITPLDLAPQGEISFSTPFQEIYSRHELKSGTKLTGPALILDPYSTTVIEEGWKGTLLDDGTWVLKDLSGFRNLTGLKSDQRSEAVNLQLYTNRFRSVADQMGEMLRKTAMSVNVKERLDFSCALLDADGYLVVNAPHIPVHLGAMGTCVRTLIKALKKDPSGFQNLTGLGEENEFKEGDIIATNHPGYGGSHLPDVTVVTPIFFNGKRIGFAASRAHHAEMGGKRPGSMPPDANNLAEEGVVIPPTFIARGGEFDWDPIKNLLQNSRWPSRSIHENMADLQAAVAANHRGAEELRKIATQFEVSEVTRYMDKLKKYAAGRMRSTLKKLRDGSYHAEEEMDDGSKLVVSCEVKEDSVSIDFTGTSGVHSGNLNANPSIVSSVVMYVLRLMVDEPLPLNDGLLDPVKLIIPNGMLNPNFTDDPSDCPAVVGGNIETSQRLADTLLKAFGLSACSYGTMNNVLFGNESFGYYETVGGGTGAGDRFHGSDAIHQHMTNTRATDPEVLEHRYPVRLDRYSIRKNSGGKGKWNGGDGLVREMTFLEPVSLSVLAQHRVVEPYGLNGGKNGQTGKQWIESKDGSQTELKWRDGADLNNGDRFVLHTPGGGGYGEQ
ncbi:hydantoinase B/oxoprolinase family protein [Rhodohalobacter sp. 8-1]|uniref:hydantoinase B/oxoprolinase family protein n=1 Tax=Rhodohalobacter sp. 8-1 TaxID=3131972 RepID=UPI0030EDF240